MARIENTTEGQFDVSSLNDKDLTHHIIPRSTVDAEGARVNGVGEIPDDILSDLLAKDAWTRGLFDSGKLVKKTGAKATAEAKADAKEDAAIAAAAAHKAEHRK